MDMALQTEIHSCYDGSNLGEWKEEDGGADFRQIRELGVTLGAVNAFDVCEHENHVCMD